MQTIKNIKSGVKNILIIMLELAHVRLDMARIELNQQKEQLVSSLISVLLLIVFLLVALISSLFGVNVYFDNPQDRLTAFLTISGVSLFIVVILVFIILNSLKKQRGFMQETLNELKYDIATIKKLAEKSHQDD